MKLEEEVKYPESKDLPMDFKWAAVFDLYF